MASQDDKLDKAVALLYDKEKSDAPRIIASGRGVIAQKIIETARQAGIHIQEDPDLVEILSKVPVGKDIPVELYQTIAEILSFVYQINDKFKQNIEKPEIT
jgi:flagellar biosynthesis protein